MADGSPVIIEELEGERRVAVFAGSDLPNQGIEVSATLRSVSTQYPGTSKKSTQILGTVEDDIELEGRFNDVLTGVAGGALAQVNTLRGLLLGQRFCELRWGGTLVRRGYIKRFAPTFFRESSIGYRLTFEVAEADEADIIRPAVSAPATTRDVQRAIDVASEVLDFLEQTADVVTGIRAVAA